MMILDRGARGALAAQGHRCVSDPRRSVEVKILARRQAKGTPRDGSREGTTFKPRDGRIEYVDGETERVDDDDDDEGP